LSIKRAKRPRRRRGRGAVSWTAIRKANKKRAPSSLETTIYSWLDEDGIKYKKEKAIGRCHVDIFIEPNIVVECNGCYWHSCSTCYPNPSKRHLLAMAKDSRRYAYFKYKKDLEVVVVRECDVVNYPDEVRKLLRSLPGR
jgi:G:T-mismatch repair DNA endonuclease (very short patch repair protein)